MSYVISINGKVYLIEVRKFKTMYWLKLKHWLQQFEPLFKAIYA